MNKEQSERKDGDWFDRVPKVELHLHLEGAIPMPAMWQLLDKYGATGEVGDLAGLEAKFRYRDFEHFIATWYWKCQFTREAEDFTFIAEAVARHLREQNVRYAEVFYSPPDYAKFQLTVQEITHAVRQGLDRVDGIRIGLIADVVRDYGAERAQETLDAVVEVLDCGVIGIGIGGNESHHPPEPFAAVYERARAAGLRTTAHAGEAAGAASIWGAIRGLGVDRIGHGTRAGEDPELLDYLAEHRVPLEMCPVSNVRTAVVPSLKEHPIRDFVDRGMLVTVNTDDPAMFQTALAEEYRELARVHEFSREEIRHLIANAVTACWLPDREKEQLRQELASDPAWNIQ